MNHDSKERLKWLIVAILAAFTVGFIYSFIRDELKSPPADQILENVTNINGFTIENLAETKRVSLGLADVGKYPDPFGALLGGFHWVTYNGKTYRAPYGAGGMIYRPEFRAENDVVVRSILSYQDHRDWYQVLRTVVTDTATDTEFAIAERWYGPPKTYRKQQGFRIEAFLYEALKPSERDMPVSVVSTDIQGIEVQKNTVPTAFPYRTEPLVDRCAKTIMVKRTDGGRRGITDGIWEWYPRATLDYVFCREDNIFLLTTNGSFMTKNSELVWLAADGQFLGRFQLDLGTNAYRTPYWVEPFEFDRAAITFDWLTGGLYPDSGPNFVPLEDRKPGKRAHITIDLTSVDRSKPVFNQRAVEGLAYSRQSRKERKSWDKRIWPDHVK